MCSILDGCSRAIVHWEIREQMQEIDVEVVLQRARERYPHASPRVITDNGPQYVARDFKEFIRIAGMTHVKTSPYYPQSNGKIERYHRTIKGECIRTRTLVSLDAAREAVTGYVHHYNEVRLHSEIGYVTPRTKLEGTNSKCLTIATLSWRRLARCVRSVDVKRPNSLRNPCELARLTLPGRRIGLCWEATRATRQVQARRAASTAMPAALPSLRTWRNAKNPRGFGGLDPIGKERRSSY